MKLLRAATLSVANLNRSIDLYSEWLDYVVAERGEVDDELAQSWGCRNAAGRSYTVLRPASGKDIFIRLIENKIHPEFVPLTTYGWAAIEVCVEDVLQANDRMLKSPFEIIGPPREIEGLDAIYPMQMKGPDGEIVYLTQIRADLPDFDLPRASVSIDNLFILVLACSDMNASLDWLEKHVGLSVGRRKLEIVYTMLAKAFDLPEDDLHIISTMVHGRDVFLELDQMPDIANARPSYADELPQGVAIGTFWHPTFATVNERCRNLWLSKPAVHASCIYDGKPAGTLHAPDGTLVEVVSE